MLEWLESGAEGGLTVPVGVLAWRLGNAFLLGCLAAGIHHLTLRDPVRPANRPFLATLVLLSVLVALVALVIGNSVARAFSLVGALAIVRFRTVVEDTRDTAFVIFAVVVGMAAGVGYLVAPLLGIPLVFLAAWLFGPSRAEQQGQEALLILRLAANQPPEDQIRTSCSSTF